MSTSSSAHIARASVEAGLELTWAQWSALGSLAHSRRGSASSMVDPEALILFSLYLAQHESRLLDQVGWWAESGSRLTSIKRMKSICARVPIWKKGLGSFARMALDSGDKRWQVHAVGGAGPTYRRGKGPPRPSLVSGATVWLRLRTAFGVSAKADVLAFLLGIHGSKVVVREIADATAYTATAVRMAADDLARGRFIRRIDQKPAQYYVPPAPWADLLQMDALPEWRFWVDTFAFMSEVAEWAQSVGQQEEPRLRVVASRARDLVDKHMAVMHLESLPIRDPRGLRGQAVLGVLQEMVDTTAAWARDHV